MFTTATANMCEASCGKVCCWAPFLRALHDLTLAHPTDAVVTAWATQVQAFYKRAVT